MDAPKAEHRELVGKKTARVPILRSGLASKGTKVQLLTNHFKVDVTNVDGYLFRYSVAIFYEDGRPVDGKGIGIKVLDRVHDTYKAELEGKDFAYDGAKSLITVGALPRKKLEFTIVLEDISSNGSIGNSCHHADGSPNGSDQNSYADGSPNGSDQNSYADGPYQSKTYKVEISNAARIPMQAIAQIFRGRNLEKSQEALRVLNIILRQHAAKEGCLLVRKSNNLADVGSGVLGFHSRVRTTQGGLSLNIDVSTTLIIEPGPVVDFLKANQNVKDSSSLDWAKAERVLKNLRVKISPTNTEYKITGLSKDKCKETKFLLKQRGEKDENGEPKMTEITVYDYFVNTRHIPLSNSGDLPCINVGKSDRPTYFPLELCSLVPLQRYTKALTTYERASLVEKSNALRINNYSDEPLLRACGVSLGNNFTQVEGRILAAPRLKVGNGDEFFPHNGRWNYKNKKLLEPTTIENWAVVNFSARCKPHFLISELIKCGNMKGIKITHPIRVFEESPEQSHLPPLVRVEQMFKFLFSTIREVRPFLLCLLPERKNSPLYGHWKRKNLTEYGFVTQCIAPTKVNDQYLTNVLLKINAKLGGLNSRLSVEHSLSNTLGSKVPTLILGMDVSHGSPGQSDVPSIAAVVSSRCWPLMSKYKAWVRTQSPKVEMIESLFQKGSGKEDDGMMGEILMDFYTSSGQKRPDQIIIFRHGVSESQFNQVLNVEVDQIVKACKFQDENWYPKFVVIISQKNHHTKFFLPESTENVPPGTVIDNSICHPQNNDFYLCAQAGRIGTTKPTHYHVLLDQVGFSPDDLQEFVHSLSYVYQRSTTAVSVVAPICYAHSAASLMRQVLRETSSSHGGGMTAAGPVPVPQLPCLDENVRDSMFFV